MGKVRRGAMVVIAAVVVAGVALTVARCGARTSSGLDASSKPGIAVGPRGTTLRPHGPNVHTRRIAGHVFFAGAPVAGATVSLTSIRTSARAEAVAKVVTDQAGRFDFGPRLVALYLLSADAPHRTSAVSSVDLLDSRIESEQLELDLQACDASLHGTIYDNAGGTIARAELMHFDDLANLASASGTVSDDAGAYELCFSSGGGTVEVRADGYASLIAPVAAYGRMHRDFILNPGATIAGHVVRASDHQPVEGAIVVLGERESTRYATADRDGRFQFDGLSPGRQIVTAGADGLVSARARHAIASVGAASEDVILELDPAFAVRGMVVDRATRAPQSGAVAILVSLERLEPVLYQGRVGADGAFVIDGLPAGAYRPGMFGRATTNDPPLTRLEVDHSLEGLVLETTAAGSISGRITLAGKPVSGADVMTGRSAYTSTHADGSYTLDDLDPAAYDVSASSRRSGAFAKARSIKLGPGEHLSGIDFELNLGVSISGTVVDQHDRPVGGVRVLVSLRHGSDTGISFTADDGTFRVEGLTGGGDYACELSRSDGQSLPPAEGRRFPVVSLQHADVTGVRIRVRNDSMSISGRVVDSSDRPVPDIAVSTAEVSSAQAVTDQAGAFSISDLRPGSYTLTTNALGGTPAQTITAGTSNVIFRIAIPSMIEGTLEGFTDRPEVVAVGGSSAQFFADVSGTTFRLRAVPPGVYTVTASSALGYASTSATVGAGGTTRVVLRAAPFGSVAGRFVDSMHHPLEGDCSVQPTIRDAIDVVSRQTSADPTGAFQIDRVPAVDVQVWCRGPSDQVGRADTTVTPGVTARAEVVAKPRWRHGTAGVEFEEMLDSAEVASVTPGGAGDRAGVQVGDVVVAVNDRTVEHNGPAGITAAFHYTAAGGVVKLIVERGGKELTFSLAFEPEPN